MQKALFPLAALLTVAAPTLAAHGQQAPVGLGLSGSTGGSLAPAQLAQPQAAGAQIAERVISVRTRGRRDCNIVIGQQVEGNVRGAVLNNRVNVRNLKVECR